jgi:hypothetical protein
MCEVAIALLTPMRLGTPRHPHRKIPTFMFESLRDRLGSVVSKLRDHTVDRYLSKVDSYQLA